MVPAHVTFWWISTFDQETVETIARMPGVADAEGEVWDVVRWKVEGEPDWRDGRAILVARADYPGEATLPHDRHSFLRIDGPAMCSAYYAEREGARVRFYECEGRGGEVTLTFDWAPSSAQAVDLLDRPVDTPVQAHGKQVTLTARPWQIVTLKLGRN